MSNIWDFLLQTVSVSLTAGLIWLIKLIFEDKLSPRWQYGVWSLLAVRCLWPVSSMQYIFPGLALRLEAFKGMAEQSLSSSFTEGYTPIRLNHVFPWVTNRPVSSTDWIFILYIIGMLLFLMRYLLGHLRLRWLLRKGQAPNEGLKSRIQVLCNEHGLISCKVVVINGLDSAFVCGVFHPVLAVPHNDIDDKILLHELLHLKHQDILQGVFWSFLRALHWCNPWIHFVVNRIENDMESLCDQRVLERLEGEARREYGAILLDMANLRYARTPGTSSISNGGKNITRRIAAIVRFKKYPRGMALVSICILVLLAYPILIGQAATVKKEFYTPDNTTELYHSMAAARVIRCSTAAGAIDTYAKGLLTGNALYIATVSPLEDHAEIEKELRSKDGNPFYLEKYSLIGQVATDYGYTIPDLNLQSDGSYHGNLAFEYYENGYHKSLLIPFHAYQQDGWVVEKTGKQQISDHPKNAIIQFLDAGSPRVFTATGSFGTVTTYLRTYASVTQEVQNDFSNIFGMTSTSTDLQPNAIFYSIGYEFKTVYQCNNTALKNVSVQVAPMEHPDQDVEYHEIKSYGSGSGGLNHYSKSPVQDDWDGILEFGSGMGCSNPLEKEFLNPISFAAQIHWNDELIGELTLEEVFP